jgi:uncharacterized protein YraI
MPHRAQASVQPTVGVVSTKTDPLIVRSNASTASSALTLLPKGSYVTLLSKNGSWWQIEFADGRYGYCHADYITPVDSTTATVTTKTDPLNIRRGPGTSYTWIGSLTKGKTVTVLSSTNGWSKVLYSGTKTGYVSSQYLSFGNETPDGVKYPAVSLKVPNYKQTDSRWASVTIGSSGQTIAKIGCATTAIAMMESYRQGKTIYPDAMSRQLRYTASGAVYWPSHFTSVTPGSNYLQDIYTKLKAGKPVLIGATTVYGGQHWVVITGYIGGDTLSAAGFTINDPGSNARINLQQFLNAYPVLYKYFYY